MSDILKFSIPGKPDYVQMVRLAIASVANNVKFDVEAVDDIKLAVAEACKNVSCHGHEGFSSCYEVSCEIFEEKLIITVTDNCDCEHSIAKSYKQCVSCPDEGNLGVFVIETLMDEVEVNILSTGNKCIKMVKFK